jgi:hypothetical protein
MKFRSWNEELGKFIYFEDGRYFNDTISMFEDNYHIFNWQNKEQGFEVKGKTFFVNDDIEFEAGPGRSQKVLKGRLVIKNNIPTIRSKGCGYFLAVLDNGHFKVLGNIHEVEK